MQGTGTGTQQAACAAPASVRQSTPTFSSLLAFSKKAPPPSPPSSLPSLAPQEIIELSCVVVNTQTLQLEGSFQRYCRPTVHPRLTDFCTGLTGISQQQ